MLIKKEERKKEREFDNLKAWKNSELQARTKLMTLQVLWSYWNSMISRFKSTEVPFLIHFACFCSVLKYGAVAVWLYLMIDWVGKSNYFWQLVMKAQPIPNTNLFTPFIPVSNSNRLWLWPPPTPLNEMQQMLWVI